VRGFVFAAQIDNSLTTNTSTSAHPGTFNWPDGLLQITGSVGDRVASAPLLIFTCPETKERASVDIGTDAQNLRAAWKSRFQVKCPYCGEDHEISVRDAYLDDAIDVPGRPARPRNPRKRPSG
jgi:hypothetical protein